MCQAEMLIGWQIARLDAATYGENYADINTDKCVLSWRANCVVAPAYGTAGSAAP